MDGKQLIIHWFRRDLRISDNPSIACILEAGHVPLPLYILEEGGEWGPGGASRWWLHHALADLDEQLRRVGSQLILRRGEPGKVLSELLKETGAAGVYWNRCYEPETMRRDAPLKKALRDDGFEVESFNSGYLVEPHRAGTKEGKPYQVFSPFWKFVRREIVFDEPVEVVGEGWPAPKAWPESDDLDDWKLLPNIPWDRGFYGTWAPTRKGAEALLDRFVGDKHLWHYKEKRDFPAEDEGTSRLSPYLHFGQMGPREIWSRIAQASEGPGQTTYGNELGWREFGAHVLYHFPRTPTEPLRPAFEKFPWRDAPDDLEKWKRGQTGYPIVDAGMRQLWETGWMHNRVRMIVASFLVKHLRIHWIEGARWFWDTLVDADLASNTLGWQWTAGCGADGAPYFRIFNPMTQAARFDPNGDYIRRWVPELKRLKPDLIFQPWEADRSTLEAAGVVLGKDYPEPMVDHAEARQAALDAFEKTKGG